MSTATTAAPSTRKKRSFNFGFDRFSGLYLWAFFIIVFSIWVPDTFPTTSTLHSVAAQQAVTGMIALAVLIPLAAGAYDLSVGATANCAGILSVAPPQRPGLGSRGGDRGRRRLRFRRRRGQLDRGRAPGRQLVHRDPRHEFDSGRDAGDHLVEQPTPPPTNEAWSNLTLTEVFGFQIVVLYLLILAIVFWWSTAHTPVGRYLYAIGGNTEAARLSGVRIERYTSLTLIISGTLAALAGVLFTSLNGPSLNFGGTLLLPAFAVAFLGSTQLTPGRFNVWGTMLAIYVLATGVQGLQLVSGASWLADMFNGVALIVAVALSIKRPPNAQWARIKASIGRGKPGDPGDADAGGTTGQGPAGSTDAPAAPH